MIRDRITPFMKLLHVGFRIVWRCVVADDDIHTGLRETIVLERLQGFCKESSPIVSGYANCQ